MIFMISETLIILYVRDQKRSAEFYKKVLNIEPLLDVPGMTEFKLSTGCMLGLMPEAGIKSLLGEKLPDPATANGIPRAELYLMVNDAAIYNTRALALGAIEISPLANRDWGDCVAYYLDPDGHVIAFAERAK
jgi:uncharacterized glyoxalase superfamily protein PhnB